MSTWWGPSTFTVAVSPIPIMADFNTQKFLCHPVSFPILTDVLTIINQAIQKGTALLTFMLVPWHRRDEP